MAAADDRSGAGDEGGGKKKGEGEERGGQGYASTTRVEREVNGWLDGWMSRRRASNRIEENIALRQRRRGEPAPVRSQDALDRLTAGIQ